ncbi:MULTISPECIES: hypothetical protein [unclassified Streptomyces]|nr:MULTISPECIES: hypothetical protein [unclassified Streptomyces]WSR09420.1 hypothetical protein OG265_26925 [Streptomyces sp. NBC_01208]WSR47852.1 hypothetical protein OG279_09560 [Streptomyces sp. NBC_01201]
MAATFFASAACLAVAALCTVALRDVPRITGTVAAIVTIAALGLAWLH